MALVPCSDCDNQVSERASACPKCGAPMTAPPVSIEPPPESRSGIPKALKLALIGGAVFVAWVVVANLSVTPEDEQRWREEDAIKACWARQQLRSNTDEAARFIAAACEQLEAEFRTKHDRSP